MMMWRDWWRVNKSPILSILMDFCCLLVRSSSGLVVLMFRVPLFSFFLLCVSVFTFLPVVFVVSLFNVHLRCVVLLFFIFHVLGLCFLFSCLLCLLLLLFVVYFKPSLGRGFIYCLFTLCCFLSFLCSRPLCSLFLSVVLAVLFIIIYFKPSLGRGLGGSSYPLTLTTRSCPNAWLGA